MMLDETLKLIRRAMQADIHDQWHWDMWIERLIDLGDDVFVRELPNMVWNMPLRTDLRNLPRSYAIDLWELNYFKQFQNRYPLPRLTFNGLSYLDIGLNLWWEDAVQLPDLEWLPHDFIEQRHAVFARHRNWSTVTNHELITAWKYKYDDLIIHALAEAGTDRVGPVDQTL